MYGCKFELETDRKPLECSIFRRHSKPSALHILKWWDLRLQGYDYKVAYWPGKANIADTLSRINQFRAKDTSGEAIDFVNMIAQESWPVALTVQQVELASDNDPEITSQRHHILRLVLL